MTNLLIGALILLIMIRSQLGAKPLKRTAYTLPLLLLLFAVYASQQANVQAGEGVAMSICVALGAVVGLIQGRLIHVYSENGIWWTQGSWLTLLIWLTSVPIRFGVKYGIMELFDIPAQLTGTNAYVPFLYSIAGILLGKAVMLTIRYPNQMLAAASGEYRRRRRVL